MFREVNFAGGFAELGGSFAGKNWRIGLRDRERR